MTGFSILSEANWLDAPRVRRIAWIFGGFVLAVLAIDTWMHTRAGVTDPRGEQLGRDFINYWAGAHLAITGHASEVYDIRGFFGWERAHTAPNAMFRWYSYPPIALLLSLPLAMFGFVTAYVVWLASGTLACAAFLKRTLNSRMALLAAFATPAGIMNATSGQNGQFSAALLAGGVLLLEKKPGIAGALFGLLAFKPHLALLVPVALAANRQWRAFGAAFATAVLLCALSAMLFGTKTWIAFLHNAPINALLMERGEGMWHRMPNVFSMARLLGSSIAAAYGAQIVSALAAAGIVVCVWRGGTPLRVRGAVLILAGFLVTPYAWDYDMVALTFAVAWLAAEGLERGFRPWEKSALALLIALPLILSPVAAYTFLQIGPLALWSGILLAARRSFLKIGISSSHENLVSQRH